MLKINKKVEYALMALKFMSQRPKDSLTSAREICETFGTPFDTMAKVMQTLNNVGILSSVKGTKGGYQLQRSLSSISYGELTEIIEGKRQRSVCEGPKGLCELHESCNIITPVEQLNAILGNYLDTLNLEKLFKGHLKTPAQSQALREEI